MLISPGLGFQFPFHAALGPARGHAHFLPFKSISWICLGLLAGGAGPPPPLLSAMMGVPLCEVLPGASRGKLAPGSFPWNTGWCSAPQPTAAAGQRYATSVRLRFEVRAAALQLLAGWLVFASVPPLTRRCVRHGHVGGLFQPNPVSRGAAFSASMWAVSRS